MIFSMRASSSCSFCVSKHARMMPKPLQMRAPTWLSSEPSDMALIVLPRALMTCPRLASRPILNCLVFIGFCSRRAVHFWGLFSEVLVRPSREKIGYVEVGAISTMGLTLCNVLPREIAHERPASYVATGDALRRRDTLRSLRKRARGHLNATTG